MFACTAISLAARPDGFIAENGSAPRQRIEARHYPTTQWKHHRSSGGMTNVFPRTLLEGVTAGRPGWPSAQTELSQDALVLVIDPAARRGRHKRRGFRTPCRSPRRGTPAGRHSTWASGRYRRRRRALWPRWRTLRIPHGSVFLDGLYKAARSCGRSTTVTAVERRNLLREPWEPTF